MATTVFIALPSKFTAELGLRCGPDYSSRQVAFVLLPRHTGVQDLPTQTGALGLVFTVTVPPTGVLAVAVNSKVEGPDARAEEKTGFALDPPLIGKGSNGSKFPLDIGGVDRLATVETFDEVVELGLAGLLG